MNDTVARQLRDFRFARDLRGHDYGDRALHRASVATSGSYTFGCLPGTPAPDLLEHLGELDNVYTG